MIEEALKTKNNRLKKQADRIEELEAEVHRLHTAEFIGRLPDYVKELETERDEAFARIEELEAALRGIDSVWNGPAGKNYPHNSDAGRAMYDIARRALGGNVPTTKGDK